MYDTISENGIRAYLNHSPCLPVYIFDTIDSTNRLAKEITDDCALIVSDTQTQGRGRLGRDFFSPKGSGIYMSLKVNIPSLYQNVPFITTLSAVAVHKAIKSVCNIDTQIKWVNDIYFKNKKTAGILCSVADDTHAVIGVGINFTAFPMPPELTDIAVSLFDTDPKATRNELIGTVTDNILSLLSLLPDTSFMEYYKAHSLVLGKNITCITQAKTFDAVALDIDNQGGLVVKSENDVITLRTGEISVRLKAQNPADQT